MPEEEVPEEQEVKPGYENPDDFPDFDEVESTDVPDEGEDDFNETAVDQSYKSDAEQE